MWAPVSKLAIEVLKLHCIAEEVLEKIDQNYKSF
jgi:hypothetical protein